LIVTFYSVGLMCLFGQFREAWRGHLDLILIFFSVGLSVVLCLFSALMAPAYKKVIVVLTMMVSIGFDMNRWQLVIANNCLTQPLLTDLAANLIGGVLVFLGLYLVGSMRSKAIPEVLVN